MSEDFDNLCDAELAVRSKNGDDEAFGHLVSKYEGRIYNFLLKKLADREEAQDVAQKVFVKAYRSIEGFKSKYRFSTWIFCIARREAASSYRRKKMDTVEIKENHSVDSTNPGGVCSENEIMEEVWSLARRKLSENEFSALWMYYREGMDVSETARVLGRASVAVRVLLYRARKSMLAVFESREDMKANEILDWSVNNGLLHS